MDDFLQEVKDVFSYLVDDRIVSVNTFRNRYNSDKISIAFKIKNTNSKMVHHYNIEEYHYDFIPDIVNCLDLLSINRPFYHATYCTSISLGIISYSLILKLALKEDEANYILKNKML